MVAHEDQNNRDSFETVAIDFVIFRLFVFKKY